MSRTVLRGLREPYAHRPHCRTILRLNAAIEGQGVPYPGRRPPGAITSIGRVLSKAGLMRSVVRLPGHAYIVAMMWPSEARFFPQGYCREIIPFCFDCWPPDYDKWVRLCRRNRFRVAFFTARGSAEYMQEQLPNTKVYWVGEAADPDDYTPDKPLAERSIDVLELGRRHKPFHEAVRGPLESRRRKHLYKKDTLLFPTAEELLDGLAETRISVCYPKSVTHPESARGLETATLRYYESIGAKCLILGHSPDELTDLFGFNPVIEVDERDPAGQVQHILSTIEEYQPHVDRAHQRMLEVGTWNARALQILQILEQEGYQVPQARAPLPELKPLAGAKGVAGPDKNGKRPVHGAS